MEQDGTVFQKSAAPPRTNRPGPATKPGVPKPPKTSQIRPKPVLNPSETAPPASPVIPPWPTTSFRRRPEPIPASPVIPAPWAPRHTGAVGATSYRRRPEPIPPPSYRAPWAPRRSGAGRYPSLPPRHTGGGRYPSRVLATGAVGAPLHTGAVGAPYTPAPWAPPTHRRRGRPPTHRHRGRPAPSYRRRPVSIPSPYTPPPAARQRGVRRRARQWYNVGSRASAEAPGTVGVRMSDKDAQILLTCASPNVIVLPTTFR